MERIIVWLPKGSEFVYGEREYLAKKDYYTTVKLVHQQHLCEVAKQAQRNIQKQIAKDMGFVGRWQIVNFYDGLMKMEYKNE